MKRMIVDTANLLFRVAAANSKYNKGGTAADQAGLAMHTALNSLNKHYKKYKPDQIAITFEGPKNWRKAYTKSAECVSKRGYKANRVKDASMDAFFELINSFEDLARNHTSLVCLSNPILEGDDLFAGYVDYFCDLGDEVVGISGDRDFAQLLNHKNFTLINPDTNKPRMLLDLCDVDDAEYFMFEKAFRGDTGDNVMPAFPSVRKTRLKKCLADEYEMTKIMNETWSITDPATGIETKYRVGDLFEENHILMNLRKQPDYIRLAITDTLEHALVNHGKYSHFHFSKFCGKYGLKQIGDNSAQFADMFGVTGQRSPLKEETLAARKSPIIEF
jgi:hypothetical protein